MLNIFQTFLYISASNCLIYQVLISCTSCVLVFTYTGICKNQLNKLSTTVFIHFSLISIKINNLKYNCLNIVINFCSRNIKCGND